MAFGFINSEKLSKTQGAYLTTETTVGGPMKQENTTSVFRWLPGKRDKKWLYVLPVMAGIFCSILAGVSTATLCFQITVNDILLWGGSSLAASVAVCGLFYAGLSIAGVVSFIGILAGIVHTCFVFLQPIEWRGLVGYVSGVQLAFMFFLTGINAQMILYLWNKRKAQKTNNSLEVIV
jgi:hypothetical protein